MIRSKKVRSIPRLLRMVWGVDTVPPCGRVGRRGQLVGLDVASLDRRHRPCRPGSVLVTWSANWRNASDAAATVAGRDDTVSWSR